MKHILSLALCLVLLAGCSFSGGSTHKSYTFRVETGDDIKVELDTTNGYGLTKEIPFEVTHGEDVVLHCTFGSVEDYEELYNNVLASEDVTLITPHSDYKDRGWLFAYTYPHDALAECNFVLCINNTSIAMSSILSKEEATAAFNLLDVSLVKGEEKVSDPVVLPAPDLPAEPGDGGVEVTPDIGVVAPAPEPDEDTQEPDAHPVVVRDVDIPGLSFDVYDLVHTGYGSSYGGANIVFTDTDNTERTIKYSSGDMSVSDLSSYFEQRDYVVSYDEEYDLFMASTSYTDFSIRPDYMERPEAAYTYYSEGTYDSNEIASSISELLGVGITSKDIDVLVSTIQSWRTAEGDATSYSLMLTNDEETGEVYLSIGASEVYVAASRIF